MLKRILVLAFTLLALGISSPVHGASIPPGMSNRPAGTESPALLVSAPVRVTQDAAVQLTPVVTRSSDGTLEIAWEQLTLLNGRLERDIFLSTSTDAVTFSAPLNVSHNPGPSRAPSLLALKNGDIHLFYADQVSSGNLQVMDAVHPANAAGWGLPTQITASTDPTAFDPIGVEADDGKIWLARRVAPGGTITDIWAQVIGGAEYNLSRFGSAVRRPAITAGQNGQIYVAWADHANELPGAALGINVRQWNGQQWVRLPNASPIGYMNFVGLAYDGGTLYCIWPNSGVGTTIAERAWSGTAWGPTSVIARGKAVTFSRIQISATGNQYVTWADSGVIYLKKNAGPAVAVSSGVANAQEPALFVDANDTAYIVYRNNDVWLTTVQ